MKSYQIHFIRHGMTAANKNGQYIGTTDISLSNEGKEKLQDMSQKYEYPKPGIIYTSPLKRCLETCSILYPNQKPITIEGLSECNFGKWEGKTAEELKNDEIFKLWLNNSSENSPPGGESGLQFAYRVCSTFEKIVQDLMKSGTTTATIVTHAGVITTLLATYGIPRANAFEWMIENGFGYSMRITPTFWMRDMVAEVYQKIPLGYNLEEDGEYSYMIDIAREAADKAYGSDN